MEPGTLIDGRFEIIDRLGNGAMGIVYKGQDQKTGDAVAIKTIRTEILHDNPELVRRFIREGRALSQLDHPHIVKVIAISDSGDHQYIVMEYVGGPTLSAQIARHGQLPVKPTIQASYAIASALAYIHEQGIIHRDIKPSNIMFTPKGSPRLMDFGVAHLDDATPLTAPGAVLGTLAYVAPEIIYGEPADHRSDIWSFGVTMYKMLTGRVPFNAKSAAMAIAEILSEPVPPVILARPDIPPALAGLVDMMLQKDRGQRINSMARVKTQLKQMIASQG